VDPPPWLNRGCGSILLTASAHLSVAGRDGPALAQGARKFDADRRPAAAVGGDHRRRRPRLLCPHPARYRRTDQGRAPSERHDLAVDGSLMTTFGDLFGQPLTLQEMSPYLPKAVIATEDRRFYHHFGIDPFGLARASFAT